ncbi:unnamed protein product, partial [marine sediment metagenome]
ALLNLQPTNVLIGQLQVEAHSAQLPSHLYKTLGVSGACYQSAS